MLPCSFVTLLPYYAGLHYWLYRTSARIMLNSCMVLLNHIAGIERDLVFPAKLGLAVVEFLLSF